MLQYIVELEKSLPSVTAVDETKAWNWIAEPQLGIN